MRPFPDLTPIFYLAIVGMALGALTTVGVVGGLIWFVVNHVRIV